MYTLGHIGSALLVYAPVAGALSVAGQARLAGVGLVVAATCSMLPDIDLSLPIEHRGITHTVWFIGTVTTVIFAGGVFLTDYSSLLVSLVALTVFISLLSHLLADSITPMGIAPFDPLWDWHHSFEVVYSKNVRANLALFWLGLVVTAFVSTPLLV